MPRPYVLAAILLAGCAAPHPAAHSLPKSGEEVLQRMRDAYAGKWYTTLRFVQKTTQYRPDGTAAIATWYESLRHTDAGTQLRIDFEQPLGGNGVLYTADSTWVVRNGKLATVRPKGNLFLPLVEGVYLQPVRRTVAELKATKADLSRVTSGTWQGRPVWIVGAKNAADTTSPQIWIDTARAIVVRLILESSTPAPPLDIHLDGYVPLAGGWLATRISMLIGGKPRLTEDYSDWKAGMPLPESLFSVATWTTAPHWAVR